MAKNRHPVGVLLVWGAAIVLLPIAPLILGVYYWDELGTMSGTLINKLKKVPLALLHFLIAPFRFLAWDNPIIQSGRESGLHRLYRFVACVTLFLAPTILITVFGKDLGTMIGVGALYGWFFVFWILGPLFWMRGRRAAAELQRRQEQERMRLESDRQRQVAANGQKSAGDQKRRDDARASAFLSFNFYSAKLGDRLKREDFDHYVATFMGDTQPPDVVERRGQELLAIFERHLQEVLPQSQSMTIEQLTTWYDQMRERITETVPDGLLRRTQLRELYSRYTELMSEAMERIRP